ncbi:MAG: cupredoxin domain-containing protein [Halobacteriota archaeon]
MKKVMLLVLAVLVGAIVMAAGCTSPSTSSPSPSSSQPQTSTAGQSTVTTKDPISQSNIAIKGFAFSPSTLTISRGATVTWKNEDSVMHTATSDTGVFDSGNLNQGDTFTYQFNDTGTFPYHCTPHPFMKGTITVQ